MQFTSLSIINADYEFIKIRRTYGALSDDDICVFVCHQQRRLTCIRQRAPL